MLVDGAALDWNTVPDGGDRVFQPQRSVDDEECGPPQATLDEIIEHRSPSLGALAAHALDREQHLLAVGAHPDDDEQRDRSRFAVEPHPHNGAVENEPYDRLIGERAGAPGLPIALHLAPNTAHRVLTDRTPEQRSERTAYAAGVGAGKIAAGDQRVGRERATLIGSQRVAFPLCGFAFRSIEPSAGHLELQLPEGPQQRARAMAVPVTSNVRCLLRIAACSHPTTSIARAAKRYLKLCFEHRLQEFAGAIPEVRFNRVEPVVEKVTCSLGLTLRLVSGRAMACHGVISAGICRIRVLNLSRDHDASEFHPLGAAAPDSGRASFSRGIKSGAAFASRFEN